MFTVSTVQSHRAASMVLDSRSSYCEKKYFNLMLNLSVHTVYLVHNIWVYALYTIYTVEIYYTNCSMSVKIFSHQGEVI